MKRFDRYDPYGPFQVSQDKAFIKNHYVPFELGSLELSEVINTKKNSLTEELNKWLTLEHENNRRLHDQGN